MRKAVCRWLPIVFGCHCRSDRSFFWRGRQFPLCARCTGELTGIILAAVGGAFGLLPMQAAILLLMPLILDGSVQLFTKYESTNMRRLITGVLFGCGLYTMAARAALAAVRWGRWLGALFRIKWGIG